MNTDNNNKNTICYSLNRILNIINNNKEKISDIEHKAICHLINLVETENEELKDEIEELKNHAEINLVDGIKYFQEEADELRDEVKYLKNKIKEYESNIEETKGVEITTKEKMICHMCHKDRDDVFDGPSNHDYPDSCTHYFHTTCLRKYREDGGINCPTCDFDWSEWIEMYKTYEELEDEIEGQIYYIDNLQTKIYKLEKNRSPLENIDNDIKEIKDYDEKKESIDVDIFMNAYKNRSKKQLLQYMRSMHRNLHRLKLLYQNSDTNLHSSMHLINDLTSERDELKDNNNELVHSAYLILNMVSCLQFVIKYEKILELENDDDFCSICREKPSQGDNCIRVPCCNKIFHRDCLHESLKHKKTCPNCRHCFHSFV